VNDTVFLPIDYSTFTYTVMDPTTLPQPEDHRPAAAIVHSDTSAANFFDPAAYAALLGKVEQEARERGLPLTILTEDDLTDLEKLVRFKTLIFPSFQNVKLARYEAIQETLQTLSYKYDVGLIAAGNFMTNDEYGRPLPGDPYVRMRSLLNVARTGGANDAQATLRACGTDHPIMRGFAHGEVVQSFGPIGTHFFAGLNTNFADTEVLARQVVGGPSYEAVIATRTGGANTFFCIESFLIAERMLEGVIDAVARTMLRRIATIATGPLRPPRNHGRPHNDLSFRHGLSKILAG
jgi:hypothetical protein